MQVTLRLFASLRSFAGSDRITLELAEPATVADLQSALVDGPLGAAAGPQRCRVAVDHRIATPDEPITDGQELALIPPVSGGAPGADPEDTDPIVAIGEGALDVGAAHLAVRDPRAGAIVVFEGVTRSVDLLRLEAYVEMARTRITDICRQEMARHGLLRVSAEHRTGDVPLSEAAILVAASAPHRAEAFAGAQAIVDRVKAEAPLWKAEVHDGVVNEVAGTLPPLGSTAPPAAESPPPILDHVQLCIPDDVPDALGQALHFYSGVLGLQLIERPVTFGPGGHWFGLRDGAALHVSTDRRFVPAHRAHPAFRVEDAATLTRLVDRLHAAGSPVRWDARLADVRRLHTADPFGNRIELSCPADAGPGHQTVS